MLFSLRVCGDFCYISVIDSWLDSIMVREHNLCGFSSFKFTICLGDQDMFCLNIPSVQFSGWVMSDPATPWTAACQASLSNTNSQSLLKSMPIKLVMPSNHLIVCHLLLLPSVFPSIRVFSKESVLHIRWPKYWSFSFIISPSNQYSGLISFGLTGLISWQSKGLSRVFSNTTV